MLFVIWIVIYQYLFKNQLRVDHTFFVRLLELVLSVEVFLNMTKLLNNACLVYQWHIGVCDGSQHVEESRTREYTLKTCIHIAVDLSSVGEAFV